MYNQAESCAGKTLLARAIASNIDANFLKVVSSAIVDKYIGESARLIREMFGYAREHQPCIIFMDEIDAIGGRRFSEGTSADREIQRTLMELLSQLDGFDLLGKVRAETSRLPFQLPEISKLNFQVPEDECLLSIESAYHHLLLSSTNTSELQHSGHLEDSTWCH